MEKHQNAIENYNIAIEYKPDFAENYLEKGISLLNLGQHAAAKENFRLAVKYNPDIIIGYEIVIKRLKELESFSVAKEYEQKLQMLKKYS
ncbi:hypothetical protein [Candidatus Orientia mediorientalis]|nr:hypothetical protein [Candidatus Orientia mediorientalis]